MVHKPVIELMELADLAQPGKIALELHKQLRAQYGTVPLQLPLIGLIEAVGIIGIKEFDRDDFEGTLVVKEGVGAIGLRRGMNSGRRNFTIAHELGHFLIPHHRLGKSDFSCAKTDMAGRRGGKVNWNARPLAQRIEIEANEFAAILIIPGPEFRTERLKLGMTSDIEHVRPLAKAFDVSQEVMAQKYVDAADEQIAIITSHDGVVKRIIAGSDFPYMGLRGGSPLPTDSVTDVFRRQRLAGEASELREIKTDAWLERRGSITGLYEQVVLQQNGWAMTLLSVEAEEVEEDANDRNWNRSNGTRR